MSRPGLKIFQLVAILLAVYQGSVAQRITLDWVEIQENKIIVHYDLLDEDSTHFYRVHLFSSHDNYSEELADVSGDARITVKPGTNKKITWDITKEMGPFHGNLTFEIRASIFVPIVKKVYIDEGRVFKRANMYSIRWVPGKSNNNVAIELYKDQRRVSGDGNQPNAGIFDWRIPVDVKPGNNYKLRFTNVNDSTDFLFSYPFAIRRKIPLVAKAFAFVVVAGCAAILSGSKSGPGTPTPPTDKKLPGPPDPP
jgi:hypothetical protein